MHMSLAAEAAQVGYLLKGVGAVQVAQMVLDVHGSDVSPCVRTSQ